MPDYAKSFGLTCVWALRWRLSGAGGVAPGGVAQSVAGAEVALAVAQPAGTGVAWRGELDLDRAGGWRLTLKPDDK